MAKELIKGNEAVVKAALLAGCDSFYGYPITPASEIAQAAATYFPRLGRTFLQAESEIASINMVFGASAAGERTMTSSSGPGISLKQEGISYLVGAELPCLVVDVMRGGPGLGNIAPEQSDYNQIVKGGGHGSYNLIVLAPNGAQEMADFTRLGFELADKWLTPVVLLTDGYIGQMMEPVDFGEPVGELPEKGWALREEKPMHEKIVTSIYMDPDELEQHNHKLQARYRKIEAEELRYETYLTEDAEHVVVGFGIVSRILRSVVDMARADGIKVGLLRPQTLWPFPHAALRELSGQVKSFMVVEMNAGQMIDDVRLATSDRKPIHFYNRMGGNVPTVEEVFEAVKERFGATADATA